MKQNRTYQEFALINTYLLNTTGFTLQLPLYTAFDFLISTFQGNDFDLSVTG